MTKYFAPQKNRHYEVYRFRQATQDRTTLDQFHTCPHTLARMCFFAEVEFETEQQDDSTSSRIRTKAVRDPTYDLKAILLDGRRDEQNRVRFKLVISTLQKQGEMK